MRVKFTRSYDHTFPSRTVINYPSNWEGAVKTDVGEAAIAAGAARKVGTASTPTTPPLGPKGGKLDRAKPATRLPGNLDPDLAVPQALTPNTDGDA